MSIKKPTQFEKWEFENTGLKKNLPNVLIPETKINDEDDDLRDFFLTLGLIFNDLKGLITINGTIKEIYKKPDNSPNGHLGEYIGIDLQILKYIQGVLLEALLYLQHKNSIFISGEVQNLIRATPLHIQIVWDLLHRVATGKSIDDKRFKKYEALKPMLHTIRNHISFHYQHEVGKPRLIDGFRKFFFEGLEGVNEESRSSAYRSTSSNWDDSRFYYSDAALQAYFIQLYGGDIQAKEYNELLLGVNSAIIEALNNLLIEYHKTKVDNFRHD